MALLVLVTKSPAESKQIHAATTHLTSSSNLVCHFLIANRVLVRPGLLGPLGARKS